MKIYKTISNTIYIEPVAISIETDGDGNFEILRINSIYTSNQNEFTADNELYVKNIRKNKKELKEELKELGLWEKGIIKAIEILFTESGCQE